MAHVEKAITSSCLRRTQGEREYRQRWKLASKICRRSVFPAGDQAVHSKIVLAQIISNLESKVHWLQIICFPITFTIVVSLWECSQRCLVRARLSLPECYSIALQWIWKTKKLGFVLYLKIFIFLRQSSFHCWWTKDKETQSNHMMVGILQGMQCLSFWSIARRIKQND